MFNIFEKDFEEKRLLFLKRQLKYCKNNSRFFSEMFEKNQISIDKIDSLQKWKDLPVLMDKKKVRDCQEDSMELNNHSFGSHLCAPLEKVIYVYSTSGTTGNPSFYCFTKNDFKVHTDLVKRVMKFTGLKEGDSIMWGFGLGNFVATSLLPILADMGVRVIPVGADAGTERLIQYTKLARPETLIGTPSFLKYMIEKVPSITGKNVADLGFRRIITGGEPGAGLTDVRNQLLNAYDAPIYDLYGPANQFANISCGTKDYHGMHVLGSDCGIWEDIIDPITNEPLEIRDGVIGNMVITEIKKEATPYLKYAMNDIIQVFTEECECGNPGPRIKVLGRADDMLIVKGVNIYPSAIQNIISKYSEELSGALKIHLDRDPPLVTPPLRITAELSKKFNKIKHDILIDRIQEKIRNILRVKVEISLVPFGSFERSVRKTVLIVRDDIIQ